MSISAESDLAAVGGSLILNPRNKKSQEPVRIDLDAYLCVRQNPVNTLNYVVVSMQNVSLDVALPIGNRLAASELAPSFDVHVHLRSLDQRGIDCDSDRERIIHGSAG